MIYKGLRDKVKILGNSLILSGLAFKQGCFMGMWPDQACGAQGFRRSQAWVSPLLSPVWKS